MTTDRKSANEIRAIWRLQNALLKSGIDNDHEKALRRAEHLRHIMQSGGATEPERLTRALNRFAESLLS
jgi:hypothetical protein